MYVKKGIAALFSNEVMNRDTNLFVWSLFCRINVNRTQGLRDFNRPKGQCSMMWLHWSSSATEPDLVTSPRRKPSSSRGFFIFRPLVNGLFNNQKNTWKESSNQVFLETTQESNDYLISSIIYTHIDWHRPVHSLTITTPAHTSIVSLIGISFTTAIVTRSWVRSASP